jgi:hypothetical protein
MRILYVARAGRIWMSKPKQLGRFPLYAAGFRRLALSLRKPQHNARGASVAAIRHPGGAEFVPRNVSFGNLERYKPTTTRTQTAMDGQYANYFEIGQNAFDFILDFEQFYTHHYRPGLCKGAAQRTT